MEVDLNILVVQENYSGGKSTAPVFLLYAKSSTEEEYSVFYFSLCYVGLRVCVLSITSLIIILVGIFLFRPCLAFPSANQSGSR